LYYSKGERITSEGGVGDHSRSSIGDTGVLVFVALHHHAEFANAGYENGTIVLSKIEQAV
jgi:hypothetical protein